MTQWRGYKGEKEECVSNLVECQRMRDIMTNPPVLNIYILKKTLRP